MKSKFVSIYNATYNYSLTFIIISNKHTDEMFDSPETIKKCILVWNINEKIRNTTIYRLKYHLHKYNIRILNLMQKVAHYPSLPYARFRSDYKALERYQSHLSRSKVQIEIRTQYVHISIYARICILNQQHSPQCFEKARRKSFTAQAFMQIDQMKRLTVTYRTFY